MAESEFTVATPLGRVHGRRGGSGPTLVLLHGLIATCDFWRFNIPYLARRFSCCALDLPGMGGSDPLPDGAADIPRLADWLRVALDALEIRSLSLVASSWGGAVALQFASVENSSLLRRLVLVSPVNPFWTPGFRQRLLLHPFCARLAASLLRRAPPTMYRRFLAEMYGDPAAMPADTPQQYAATVRVPSLPRTVAGYVRNWHRNLASLKPRLAGVRVPVLLIWGDRDRAVPYDSAAALRDHLPRAELRLLPGLGHLPYVESPERFHRELDPFLFL